MWLSRSPESDGRGQGGRTGCWLPVGVLRDYREVQLFDLDGDVGAGDTPSVQGQKKETLNRTLIALSKLGGGLTNGRCPALQLSGASPSNSLRMRGLMCQTTFMNWS
jgi:hypothetical protein